MDCTCCGPFLSCSVICVILQVRHLCPRAIDVDGNKRAINTRHWAMSASTADEDNV